MDTVEYNHTNMAGNTSSSVMRHSKFQNLADGATDPGQFVNSGYHSMDLTGRVEGSLTDGAS